MNNMEDVLQPKPFQFGEVIFFQEHDWKVAEIQGDLITLYRDKVDGQPKAIKILADELKEQLAK